MRGNTIFGHHDPRRVFHGVETDASGAFHLPGEADWVTVWHAQHSPATVKPEEARLVRLEARGSITGSIGSTLLAKLSNERHAHERDAFYARQKEAEAARAAKIKVKKQNELHEGRKVYEAHPEADHALGVVLDRKVKAKLDEKGSFSFPNLEAGVHGVSIGEGWFTGVHVEPGKTTHVTWDGQLTDAAVEVRAGGAPFDGSERAYFAGLGTLFTHGDTLFRRSENGTYFKLGGHRLGSYVLYTHEHRIGFFDLDGSGRAVVDLGDADLTVYGAPGRQLFLVPAHLTESPIVVRVASLFPQKIGDTGELRLEPLPVGRYAIHDPKEGVVSYVDVGGPGAAIRLP